MMTPRFTVFAKPTSETDPTPRFIVLDSMVRTRMGYTYDTRAEAEKDAAKLNEYHSWATVGVNP